MIPGFSLMLSPKVAGGGGTVYLDSLAVAPSAALSLKKLISTATNCIRVRRSIDDTAQDFGFSGEYVDSAAILAFVGGGSGYVQTIYDQTGNGWNATIGTTANQPRIVNAGTIDATIVFDGNNDTLAIPSMTHGAAQVGIYAKLSFVPDSNYRMIAESGPDGGTTAGGFAVYGFTDSASMDFVTANGGSGTAHGERGAIVMASLSSLTVLFDRSTALVDEIKVWKNGTSVSTAYTTPTEQTGVFSTQTLNIGSRNQSALFAPMGLESLVLYDADTATIRSSIEAIL